MGLRACLGSIKSSCRDERRVSDINATNSRIVRYCYTRNIPILGICYGCQIIALTLGGSLRRLEKPIKDFAQVIVKGDSALVLGKGRAKGLQKP